jgi:predicted MFS family arabinose efflux permease
VSALLIGFGGIIASSSGAALLADATEATRRATRFGQQIALGTTAAFLSSAIAGALAVPVASLLGARPDDALVLRALVASGGIIAAASIVPVLAIRAVPVAHQTLAPPKRNDLVRRFLVIELLFGFGAGSFLPFLNLFFADRYGIPFSALGLLLGVLAVAGSIGALLHGRFVAARLGAVPSIVIVEALSLPFALIAGFTAALPIAVGALAVRHFLMFGVSGTVNAFQLSSFTPAERAGANAFLALAWSAANAVGAILSGAIRARLGADGFTVNVVTLVIAYGLAALLTWRLFARHEPSGDIGMPALAVPDSRG